MVKQRNKLAVLIYELSQIQAGQQTAFFKEMLQR